FMVPVTVCATAGIVMRVRTARTTNCRTNTLVIVSPPRVSLDDLKLRTYAAPRAESSCLSRRSTHHNPNADAISEVPIAIRLRGSGRVAKVTVTHTAVVMIVVRIKLSANPSGREVSMKKRRASEVISAAAIALTSDQALMRHQYQRRM